MTSSSGRGRRWWSGSCWACALRSACYRGAGCLRYWLIPFGALALLCALDRAEPELERQRGAHARRGHSRGPLRGCRPAGVERCSTGTAGGPPLAGLAFAAVLVSGLAVASRLAPDAFPANDVKRVFDIQRLNYPFHYWNAVGAWSAMSIAMALAWSAHAKLLATRVLFAAALPICGLAVYLTYSRAGVVGSVAAVLVVVALSHNRWVAAAHGLAARRRHRDRSPGHARAGGDRRSEPLRHRGRLGGAGTRGGRRPRIRGGRDDRGS